MTNEERIAHEDAISELYIWGQSDRYRRVSCEIAIAAIRAVLAAHAVDLTQTPRACVVPDDPGMVVRGARPTTEADRAVLREQWIAKVQEGR